MPDDAAPPLTNPNPGVEPRQDAIHINIDPRLLYIPGAAAALGMVIGFRRGSRLAALRFLAENAHRPPTTVQGWYFYNKTKNYRVLLAGAQAAARDAAVLAATGTGWVAVEQGVKALGPPWDMGTEVAAGLGTAGVYCALYRLPWKTSRRTLLLGATVGTLVGGLQALQARLAPLREEIRQGLQDESAQTPSGENAADDDRPS